MILAYLGASSWEMQAVVFSNGLEVGSAANAPNAFFSSCIMFILTENSSHSIHLIMYTKLMELYAMI